MLGWSEYGAAEGRPVFVFHGTPSSRLGPTTLHDAAVHHGLRLIAPDRPGIGASDPMPGFSLLEWPAEASALADHLGLGAYAVFGVSGGGPYALACGVEPDPRLLLIGTAGGAAPYDRTDATVGVTPSDRAAEILAGVWPAGSRVMMSVMGLSARWFPRIAWRSWESELADSDKVALERLPVTDRLEPFVEAQRPGAAGTVDDYRILSGPWGFLPEEVSVPVVMWHGGEDPTVPLHHAQDLAARIPRSELFVVPGVGHLLVATSGDLMMAGLADRLSS